MGKEGDGMDLFYDRFCASGKKNTCLAQWRLILRSCGARFYTDSDVV